MLDIYIGFGLILSCWRAGGSRYPELCTLLTKMIWQDDHQVFGCLTRAITSLVGARHRQGHTRSLEEKISMEAQSQRTLQKENIKALSKQQNLEIFASRPLDSRVYTQKVCMKTYN